MQNELFNFAFLEVLTPRMISFHQKISLVTNNLIWVILNS